jgi:LysM repeat protein
VKCNNNLDFSLLRIYKPIDALIRECIAPCRYCGELHSTFMVKSHESGCPRTPLSDLVKEMTEELPTHIPKSELTEQDLRDFYVQKNLLHGYQQMVNKYTPTNGACGDDGFITHVIADTDTLSGIALRYGVSMNELRKANRLVGNGDQALYKLLVLRVPVSDVRVPAQEETLDTAAYNLLKRRTIARFARKSGCNNLDEAQYYLETYHYDFEKALAEFQIDARVALPTPPATISVTHVPQSISTPSSSKASRRCCSFFL